MFILIVYHVLCFTDALVDDASDKFAIGLSCIFFVSLFCLYNFIIITNSMVIAINLYCKRQIYKQRTKKYKLAKKAAQQGPLTPAVVYGDTDDSS